MVDYPNDTKGIGKKQGKDGLSAKVIETGIEGRGPEKESIRKGTDTRTAAGHIGASNANHA